MRYSFSLVGCSVPNPSQANGQIRRIFHTRLQFVINVNDYMANALLIHCNTTPNNNDQNLVREKLSDGLLRYPTMELTLSNGLRIPEGLTEHVVWSSRMSTPASATNNFKTFTRRRRYRR
jgi:hypothetical protein